MASFWKQRLSNEITSQLSKQTPVWFSYVLVDGLLTSFNHQSFDDRQKNPIVIFGHWRY